MGAPRRERALTPGQLFERLPSVTTLAIGVHRYPVIDGYVVPDDPILLLGTKAQANVPLIIGHNTAEGLFFARDAVTTVSAYRDFVRATVPAGFVDEVLARYPAAPRRCGACPTASVRRLPHRHADDADRTHRVEDEPGLHVSVLARQPT